MPLTGYISRLHKYSWEKIPMKYHILVLSVMTGLLSGLAAVVLKNLVHFIQYLLTIGFVDHYHNYLYFFYPLIGLLLTAWFIKKFLSDRPIGHGVPNALRAISKRNAVIKRVNMISSLITSAITVGFGGSVGLEGPAVGTSAAIGSNLGRWFNVDYKTRKLLIGCAAASALASLFMAPIAAIVFAIEVIMLDLTTASLIPLLLASASANITSKLFLGDDILFHVDLKDVFKVSDMPYYVGLGIFAGLFSIYFSKIYFFFHYAFEKIKSNFHRALIAGVLLGIMIFFLPPIYGEGFQTVNQLLAEKPNAVFNNSPFFDYQNSKYGLVLFLLATLFIKAFATSITLGGGGVGGVFAPTLFMGGVLGFTYSKILEVLKIVSISPTNFALVGMGALMAGILHAPLTAIFLIAEVTGGYELFIPLMITASIAFVTAKVFLPHSIYTSQLAEKGELITHHKDQAVLTLMRLQSEIESDFEIVKPDYTLGELVTVISKSKRNIHPVVDDNMKLLGMVILEDVRSIMFNREQYENTTVSELMTYPEATIEINENMDAVMAKFEETGAWNLPVVKDGIYVGFVSKSKLFTAYRNMLVDMYAE